MNELPQAIADYIAAANAQAPERLATCFTPDAIVHDEGHEHRGRGRIAAWVRDTGMRYDATIEPGVLDEISGGHRLQATVRGNFPGSPIALHFHFILEAGAIASLEIKP
ncbi:nuclear transport factor 2 family protein [Massilia aurea]|uniref:nuclear transport factor 2 family protein n=1 Tax=Massilia aurea TaxID=373040 RepID=UPI0034635B8F